MKEIGQCLLRHRTLRKLTTKEAADVAGISEDKYLKTEAGEYDISLSSIIRLAAHYGLAMKNFFEGF